MILKKRNLLLLKLAFLIAAFIFLYYEIQSYSGTRGSIGEYILLPVREHLLLVCCGLMLIIGGIFLFAKSKAIQLVILAVILVLLFLFFPIFDMEGVKDAF